MPLLQRTDVIAANGFNSNVWTGTQYEFAPYDAVLEMGVLGSAAGLQVTFATGSDTLAIDQAIGPVRAAGQYPLVPDDFLYFDIVGGGQRIIEAIRNSTAGALSHFSTIRLNPL